jgi:hypothetical protein
MNGKSNERYSGQAEKRRETALRRMLSTPNKLRKPIEK